MSASNRWWRDYDAECAAYDDAARDNASYGVVLRAYDKGDRFEVLLVSWLSLRVPGLDARPIL